MTTSRKQLYGRLWPVLLLLPAFALRMWALDAAPPGLTHDEADHGLSAWQIVTGEQRPIYFTVGYGREPLFDYATAALFTILGPGVWALRLTAVFFSLITLSGSYTLAHRLFNRRVALMTLAGLTAGFWSLMLARQGLRTITLPAVLVLAVLTWWPAPRRDRPGAWTAAAAVLWGVSFYTYLPARLMWLLLPALLLWWAIWPRHRSVFRERLKPTAVVLAGMTAIAAPLLLYLRLNPQAETRVGQLWPPITAALSGDFGPLLHNALGGFRILAFVGDTAWRYNIPARPLLPPLWGLFAGLGLLLVIRQTWRGPAAHRRRAHLLLGWLLLGMAPVLITGPELSTTRAAAILPILYLFPALIIDWLWDLGGTQTADQRDHIPYAITAVVLLYGYTFLDTAQTYFFDWAGHPQVRVQYETATVNGLRYLNQGDRFPAAVSSTTPGRYHSQPVGLLVADQPHAVRWFDGRSSLVIVPQAEMHLLTTGFAPLGDDIRPWVAEHLPDGETIPMQDDDRDTPVTAYTLDGRQLAADVRARSTAVENADFGAAQLIGYRLEPADPAPGDRVQVWTVWRVNQPAAAETVLFTHLVGPSGPPIAQTDRLDVPGSGWVSGDLFVQHHAWTIPAHTAPGDYRLVVGLYNQADGRRWTTTNGRDHVQLERIDLR